MSSADEHALNQLRPYSCPACGTKKVDVITLQRTAWARCSGCGVVPPDALVEIDEDLVVAHRDALIRWQVWVQSAHRTGDRNYNDRQGRQDNEDL